MVAYLDDIVIFFESDDFDEHMRRVRAVMEALSKADFASSLLNASGHRNEWLSSDTWSRLVW